jgi:signal transduction histidine kinase
VKKIRIKFNTIEGYRHLYSLSRWICGTSNSIVALIFLICSSYSTAAPIELNEKTKQINLYPYLSYLVDNEKKLTINDVIKEKFEVVEKESAGNLAFGYTGANHWIKVELRNSISASEWFLEVGYPLLDVVEFYVVDQTSVVSRQITGDHLLFSQRPLEHRHFVFPIELEQGDQLSLYLKVSSQSSLKIPLTLWEQKHFIEQDQTRVLGQGLFFGILIIMIVYNLFIFISIREKAYLFYVFYVASNIVVQASLKGFSYQFVLFDHPDWNDKLIIFGMNSVIFFACVFALNFLNLKHHSQLAYHLLRSIAALSVLSFMLALSIEYQYAIMCALLLVTVSSVAITCIGLSLWLLNGLHEARYFSVAWLSFLVGSLLLALNRLQIISDNVFTENAAQWGAVIEIVFLSFALADKLGQLRKEKVKVTEKAKQSLEKTNIVLSDTLTKLEESNNIKNKFLGTISHELRTPMNGIIGTNSVLQTFDLPKNVKQFVKANSDSAKEMMSLIDSMLQFIEVQSGLSEIELEKISLETLLHTLSTYAYQKIEGTKLGFNVQNEIEEPLEICGDRDKLNTVLSILVDNAAKYTDNGGITVRVSFSESGEEVVFTISDTGIGIEKKFVDKIFDAFLQADGSSSRNFGGLGMGLTLAKVLVNTIEARLEVTSKVGKGSNFILTVPIKP